MAKQQIGKSFVGVGVLGLATLLFGWGCTPSGTAGRVDDPGLPESRDAYIESNPTGVYNEFIDRGQVVPGMHAPEVIASWGMPSLRSLESRKGEEFELWTYRMKQEETGTHYFYRLFFRNYTLEFWEVDRVETSVGMEEDLQAVPVPETSSNPLSVTDKN